MGEPLKITAEEARELTYNSRNFVEQKIVGQRRWVTEYEGVLKKDGRFYLMRWERGSTECQDEGPFEHHGDDEVLEFPEVFPREKTITVYEP